MEGTIIQTKKTAYVTKYRKTYQDRKGKEIKQEVTCETDELRPQTEYKRDEHTGKSKVGRCGGDREGLPETSITHSETGRKD